MTIYRLRVQFDGADDVPHGGYKSSVFGREGGPEVMERCTQHKSVWIDLS